LNRAADDRQVIQIIIQTIKILTESALGIYNIREHPVFANIPHRHLASVARAQVQT
jgi:hypothetical protein